VPKDTLEHKYDVQDTTKGGIRPKGESTRMTSIHLLQSIKDDKVWPIFRSKLVGKTKENGKGRLKNSAYSSAGATGCGQEWDEGRGQRGTQRFPWGEGSSSFSENHFLTIPPPKRAGTGAN